MNPSNSATPFKPVSKADAAEVLGVSTKTIDNYIKSGLLPAPRPFGGRELWHPDVFYARLHGALMPSPAGQPGGPTIESPVLPSDPVVDIRRKAAGKRARDSSPMVRQKQRAADKLSELNGNDAS
jgi:hypothetical protein